MYKSLATCAAAAMLAAFAASSPTAAADQTHATGVNTQQQNAGEEFSSQRRWRHRRYVVRRYWGPRAYWGPGPYAYYGAYPYAYSYPYPYYRRPFISVGPFAIW